MADIRVLPIQPKNTQEIHKETPPHQTSHGVFHPHKINAHTQSRHTNAQNTTLLSEQGNAALKGLLEDPLSTIRYIHSFMILKEVLSLLDINAESSLHQLANTLQSMMISKEEILQEILFQHQDSSSLQGPLIQLIHSNLTQDTFSQSHLNLLLDINAYTQRQFIANSLKSQLMGMMQDINDKTIQEKIIKLFVYLEESNSSKEFIETFNVVFKHLEALQLPSSKQAIVRMLQYNASRYHKSVTQEDILQKMVKTLKLTPFEAYQLFQNQMAVPPKQDSSSKVIKALIQMLDQEQIDPLESSMKDVMIKVVKSMLSSPSHVLPLMHFIIPVQINHREIMSEWWCSIQEKEGKHAESIHVLISIHVSSEHVIELEFNGQGHHLQLHGYGCERTQALLHALEPMIMHHSLSSKYTITSYHVHYQSSMRSIFDVFNEYHDHFIGVNTYV
ncbi:MAG: hypothetical protein KGZ38_02160 [Erysipelothrix sp.]|nr:hypothetical protein [Erysipelothrix sp.]